MMEALQYDFMQHALLAGVLVSIACGIIGTFVVLNRVVFLSAGIAHVAYGGVGLGYFLRINPVASALVFSVLAALGMGVVQRTTRQRADTIIGAMWAMGMAVGIILVDRAEGYKADLMSYLFGSILAVPQSDLWMMLALDVVIILVVTLFRKELVAMSFDESFAAVRNVSVTALYLTLVALIALTVVMLMKVVGLILVIALLTMPAAVSAMIVRDVGRMMVVAGLLGMVFTTVGLWLSFTYDLTSGAAIVLVAAACYLVSLAIRSALRRPRPTRARAHMHPNT